MAINKLVPPAEACNAWQTASIEEIRRETASVKTFRLRPSLWHSFAAGQHLEVRLTAEDGYQALRSYSIGSSPETAGTYEITVDRLEGGEVSGWFHDVADVGDSFEIRGPFGGYFVLEANQPGPILFFAGGSGIVPIISMIRHRALRASDTAAMLLYASRSWDEAIFRDELLGREWEPHLSVYFALSRDQPRRAQDFGRRLDDDIVRSLVSKHAPMPETCYVCGPNAFAESAAQSLINAGISAHNIRTERFGG
jgi:ferredoxin-NADP reductase